MTRENKYKFRGASIPHVRATEAILCTIVVDRFIFLRFSSHRRYRHCSHLHGLLYIIIIIIIIIIIACILLNSRIYYTAGAEEHGYNTVYGALCNIINGVRVRYRWYEAAHDNGRHKFTFGGGARRRPKISYPRESRTESCDTIIYGIGNVHIV